MHGFFSIESEHEVLILTDNLYYLPFRNSEYLYPHERALSYLNHRGNKDEVEERVTVIDNTFYDVEPILLFRFPTLYDKIDRFYIVESK